MAKKRKNLILVGTILAYCLIGAEIIIMISPFAIYFYSVYGPVLQLFASSPLTNWLTEFFLPHMVFPDDPLLNAISYLQVFMVLGLVLFFTAAVPLYYGRFTGKGVVQFSFYSKIRHPQYLFLAISGFGLLLYWPRFIILVMYVTMLFVYYALARNEEWRMKHEQPLTYEDYMRSTPMFIPGEPGGIVYRFFFGWLRPKWLGLIVCYLCVLFLSLQLAMQLRDYALHTIPRALDKGTGVTVVSVFPRPAAEILEIYEAALDNPEVQQALAEKSDINLAYIMPGDFFLTALITDEDRRFSDELIERFPEVLEWHQYKFSGGLGKFFRIFYNFVKTLGTVETNYDIERLVFVKVTKTDGTAVLPENIFDLGLQRVPALIVDLESRWLEVHSVVRTSESHKWGSMPMPTF